MQASRWARTAVALLISPMLALALTSSARANERNVEASEQALFVGNSLIYFYDVPDLAERVAAGDGRSLQARMIAAPGATSADHFVAGEAVRALREQPWTHLVLQEQGGALLCVSKKRPDARCEALLDATRRLAAIAHEHEVRFILLGTWQANEDAQASLTRAEARVAREVRADAVIRLGEVQHRLMQRWPRWDWLGSDGVHPGADASLLAALLLHDAMYDEWPSLDVPMLRACEHAMPDGRLTQHAATCRDLTGGHMRYLLHSVRGICGDSPSRCVARPGDAPLSDR